MENLNKQQAIDLIQMCMPYPNDIKDIDAESEPQAILFTWREERYRLNLCRLFVETQDGGEITNSCLLMTDLLRAYNRFTP